MEGSQVGEKIYLITVQTLMVRLELRFHRQ
jgi:hypothetical protein